MDAEKEGTESCVRTHTASRMVCIARCNLCTFPFYESLFIWDNSSLAELHLRDPRCIGLIVSNGLMEEFLA